MGVFMASLTIDQKIELAGVIIGALGLVFAIVAFISQYETRYVENWKRLFKEINRASYLALNVAGISMVAGYTLFLCWQRRAHAIAWGIGAVVLIGAVSYVTKQCIDYRNDEGDYE
jgi:hypothetical protein